MIKGLFKIVIFIGTAALALPTQAKELVDEIDYGLYDTDILLVQKNGELIYEGYRNGYKPDQKHRLWSMTKSITNLIVGRAVKEGRWQIEDSVCLHLQENLFVQPRFCDITISDLLYWQPGVEWDETILSLNLGNSNLMNLLYGRGVEDISAYYLGLEVENEPGTSWRYSTGDTTFIWYLLRQIYSPAEYDNLMWDKILTPLDITNATFERDHAGHFFGGSYLYLSAHDMLKVANLALDEYENSNYLPQGWMQSSTTARANAEFTLKMVKKSEAPAIPGAHWWVNQPVSDIQAVPWPEVPADAFAAFGVFGQITVVIPSQKIVIVRLAQDFVGGYNRNRFFEKIYEFINEREN